jgi:hypothetical protein
MKHKRLIRGTTLIELLTASMMTVLVVGGSVAVLLYGLTSWARGQGRIMAETDSQKAVRVISQQLREAMVVTVDSNGLGLSYRMPAFDGSGNYITPAIWDNVNRRMEFSGSKLNIVTGGVPRTVCTGVILTDPQSPGGTGTYKIFTAPAGAVTRQITVQVVTQRNNYKAVKVTSRTRETIFLRNVPELTR